MKRIAIVLALSLLLPLNALALQSLSTDDMDGITGQAGVSIAIDDVIIYQNIESISYTDLGGTTDDYATPADNVAGAINISNLYMMVNINAITSLDADGLPVSPGRAVTGTWADADGNALFNFNNTDVTGDGISDVFIAKALTIDVGTLAVLSAGATNNATIKAGTATELTMAGVQIGLPTMEITQTALTFDVTVTSEGAHNNGASYGQIHIGQNTMGVLDGVIEIAPH